jgi:hypothetical protein
MGIIARRQLREQGIDPADHGDADVEAILEARHDWLVLQP